MTRISLIATVLNEGESIRGLMDSVVAQTQLPDEFVIVDGGSSDNTVAILESYANKLPLKIIVEMGCNISAGRNRAIEAATGEIIAITDAGVRLSPQWLEQITMPLLQNAAISVVAGFFEADPQTAFEIAMGATVLPLADEIDPQTFLPSSRSIALRKSAAQQVEMYPVWLDYCEDLIFDLRLKATQPDFVFVPGALVYFRPRETLRAFYKQYYLYARGDGKADLWRKRHLIRYITYLLIVPGVLLAGLIIHPAFLLLYLIGGVIYMRQPYRRLPIIIQDASDTFSFSWLYMIGMIPVIRIVGD
ncbi:MAG: glycosyltransferase, partial [Aggregatilineales bacterium]